MKNLSDIIKIQSQTNPKFMECSFKLKKLLEKCQAQAKIQPVMIYDKIFVGNISAATNFSFLQQNNIKLIISCVQIQPTHKFNNISYHQVPIKDRENQPISEYFQKVWNWIQNQPGNILIHCWGGKSRSVAIALSYILKKNFEHFSFQEIYQQLKIKYPLNKINTYFQKQLKQYYEKIKANKPKNQQNLLQIQNKILINSQKVIQSNQTEYIQINQDEEDQKEPPRQQSLKQNDKQSELSNKKIDNSHSLIDFDVQKVEQISLLDEQLKNKSLEQNNVDLLDINQQVSILPQIKKQSQNQQNLIELQDNSTVYSESSQISDVRFEQKLQQNITTIQNGQNLEKQQEIQQAYSNLKQENKQENQQELCGSGQARKQKKKKKKNNK